MARNARMVVLALAVLFPLVGCTTAAAPPAPTYAPTSTPAGPPTPKPTPRPTLPPWYPSDFKLWADDRSIAFRFLTRDELDCSYSGTRCWGMYVVPEFGCPSALYVELSVEDANGTVIGRMNDLLGSVSAGQKAKMVFDTFDKSAEMARISEINCY